MSTLSFKEIPAGRLFRLAEPETICSRSVMDRGVFVKIGNSHAVCVQAGMNNKTIIPGRDVKCFMLPGKHDTSHLEDWAIVNMPYSKKY